MGIEKESCYGCTKRWSDKENLRKEFAKDLQQESAPVLYRINQ